MEIRTSAVLTPGDTPAAVGMSPKTIHGWRPISVKIQPNELPSSGVSGRRRASLPHQTLRGIRPRLNAQSTQIAASADDMPMPIINRNVQ
jgi:hypothetical protein